MKRLRLIYRLMRASGYSRWLSVVWTLRAFALGFKSVAYSVVSDRTEKFGGHPVRIITEAALKEVSLVPRGAIKQAFAFLSDTVNTPTIVGMERSAVFALDQATHNMRRANAAILENTAQLTERVDRLCEQAGIGPTSNSSMSSEANDVLAGLDRVVKGLENLRAA